MLRCILLCSCMLLLVQLAHQQATTANESPLIETTLGRIRGSVMTSRKGRDFYAYRGIYYAKAPTGQRRFAPPEPVEPWNNTLDALADGYTCPQTYPNLGIIGEAKIHEDCLSLNVFTANVMASNPVIVYIHGGANVYGSPNSETEARPHYLLDHDVVLVAVYYRLGAFGFLSTGTPDVYGNIGYLDQVLALKWVQQHIANFGGDPNKVALMGYSAGSFAVTAHLASPLSAGLFHALIAQSGSVTGPAEVNNVYWTRQLAHELGCPKFGAQYMLNCLRKFSWQEIVEVCQRWDYTISNVKWNYEVDGNFLLEYPREALRNNRFNRVPILTGTSISEFDSSVQSFANDVDLLNDIDLNFGLYAADLLDFKSTGNDDERAIAMRQFYFNTAAIDQNSLVDMGHMRSDCMIAFNVHELVQLAKDYTSVYYYRFDYTAENSVSPGVSHGEDRRYTLPTINNLVGINSTDNFMVDRMTTVLSSFAAYGAPPVLDNVNWPPFTARDPVVMYIDKDLYTGGPYNVERYALWDRLFPLEESSAEIQVPPKESSAEAQVPPKESSTEIPVPLKESSAEIQFPAIVVLVFAAAWHLLL